ncbi:Hypothetical predicted protein [Podarcis lilfordi]|uniref:Uncharacterized protein n=1 Tax=Podarcis lilfordi TaxID=74358 RepID=A0AA35KSQ7_9SAUR|nr:Hypothetical predicted protein [Podarcis lilfordi]
MIRGSPTVRDRQGLESNPVQCRNQLDNMLAANISGIEPAAFQATAPHGRGRHNLNEELLASGYQRCCATSRSYFPERTHPDAHWLLIMESRPSTPWPRPSPSSACFLSVAMVILQKEAPAPHSQPLWLTPRVPSMAADGVTLAAVSMAGEAWRWQGPECLGERAIEKRNRASSPESSDAPLESFRLQGRGELLLVARLPSPRWSPAPPVSSASGPAEGGRDHGTGRGCLGARLRRRLLLLRARPRRSGRLPACLLGCLAVEVAALRFHCSPKALAGVFSSRTLTLSQPC